MSITGGFFNSRIVNGQYDRTYLAEDFAKCMTGLVTNGVIVKHGQSAQQQLKVTAGSAGTMQLKVSAGRAWVNGYWFENSSELTITAPAFNLSENRIDAVVLKLDMVNREFSIYVKQGTPGTPTTITPQRNSDIYEMFLAVYVGKPTYTDITDVDIQDRRADTDVCGYCRMAVDAIDGKNNLTDIDWEGYNGLTTEEKNNGTAYFITDRNCIMRNSNTYGYSGPPIADPMTQEEYDLIDNPDENTLYIIKESDST